MFSSILNRGGTWWFTSESDPRWKASGSTRINAFYGDPPEAKKALEQLEAKFGSRPDDLKFGFMKD